MIVHYVCNQLCKYRANGLDTLEKCSQCPIREKEVQDIEKLTETIQKGDAFQILPPKDSDLVHVLKEIRAELKDVNRNLRALKK